MTTELQRVMARYEEARIQYKKAVLNSLQESSRGEGIRQAIRDFQQASADLRRVTGAPVRMPQPTLATHRPRPTARQANDGQASFGGFAFFRRLLSAG
jgi:hypothetical protein